jgi:16S rRNA (cytidine1402-2'-O)-methyltransferase
MLSLVATPIGNLADITYRAVDVLKKADVIVCEDTREVIKILRKYQIPAKKLISFYEEVEANKQEEILKLCTDNNVALVSDSGTPLISDPGYKLIRDAIARNIPVETLPGPCAAITALVASGLPPDKFTFWGFPKKNKATSAEGTNIYFVSPHKLVKFLQNLDSNQQIVICRELTKIYEEVWQGTVADAIVKFAKPKGEFVVLWHI